MAREQLIKKMLDAIEEAVNNPEPGQSAAEFAEQVREVAKANEQEVWLDDFLACMEL